MILHQVKEFAVASFRRRNKNVKLHTTRFKQKSKKGQRNKSSKALEHNIFVALNCCVLFVFSFFAVRFSLAAPCHIAWCTKKCVAMNWKKRKLKNCKRKKCPFYFLFTCFASRFLFLDGTQKRWRESTSNNMKFLQCFFAHK